MINSPCRTGCSTQRPPSPIGRPARKKRCHRSKNEQGFDVLSETVAREPGSPGGGTPAARTPRSHAPAWESPQRRSASPRHTGRRSGRKAVPTPERGNEIARHPCDRIHFPELFDGGLECRSARDWQRRVPYRDGCALFLFLLFELSVPPGTETIQTMGTTDRSGNHQLASDAPRVTQEVGEPR